MNSECKSCGVSWFDHPSIETICAKVERLNCALVALEAVEELFSFHEGNEKPLRGGACPVIVINASKENGDFQTHLAMMRAAISRAKEGQSDEEG